MKKSARRKLRSQNGATMLMALLLMLVALMVSAVIISAAVSTVAGVRTGKEQQQAYLTVDSAVECFRQTLETKREKLDNTGTEKYLYEIDVTQKYSNQYLTQPDGAPIEEVRQSPDGPFGKVLMDAMDNIIHNQFLEFRQTYEITLEENYAPVTLELTLTPIYERNTVTGGTMEAIFYTDADSGSGLCRMRLSAEATLEIKVQKYATAMKTITVYGVSWDKATVETPKATSQGGKS